jgi:hypothetical protein
MTGGGRNKAECLVVRERKRVGSWFCSVDTGRDGHWLCFPLFHVSNPGYVKTIWSPFLSVTMAFFQLGDWLAWCVAPAAQFAADVQRVHIPVFQRNGRGESNPSFRHGTPPEMLGSGQAQSSFN